MDSTSEEIDRIDHDRRRALALLGLWSPVAYVAPVLLTLSSAHAQGEGGSGDGDDGHGSGGEDDGPDSSDSGRFDEVVPPEAP